MAHKERLETMMIDLTYEEKLLLHRLLHSASLPDHDRTAERVLVNSSLAARVDGELVITSAGRQCAEGMS